MFEVVVKSKIIFELSWTEIVEVRRMHSYDSYTSKQLNFISYGHAIAHYNKLLSDKNIKVKEFRLIKKEIMDLEVNGDV